MRPHPSLLVLILCACGPKADSPPTNVPGGDEADDVSAATSDDDDAGAAAAAEDDDTGPVKVTLHNLCDKPQSWVVIDGDVTPDPSAGQDIAPGATAEVELGADQWVVRKDDAGGWSSRARANADGGHVWMSSSCEGIGASDDPGADPAAIDAQMREKMRKATGG